MRILCILLLFIVLSSLVFYLDKHRAWPPTITFLSCKYILHTIKPKCIFIFQKNKIIIRNLLYNVVKRCRRDLMLNKISQFTIKLSSILLSLLLLLNLPYLFITQQGFTFQPIYFLIRSLPC